VKSLKAMVSPNWAAICVSKLTGTKSVTSKFVKYSAVLGTVVLAGCSEVSFKDAFDMGKVAPDETQVQQNQALTMPPDLQLRAPGGGAVPQAPVASSAPPVSTQPPQYGQVPPNAAQPQYDTQPQRQASVPPNVPPTAQPTVPVQDVYARNGISRVRPDGTPKSNAELIAELRAQKQKRQRESNPNYGTVFNLPSVWKDGG